MRPFRRLTQLGLVLVGLLSSIGIAEVFTRFSVFTPEERQIGSVELWKRYRNTFTQEFTQWNPGCSYSDTLMPHPYLQTVHHRFMPCGTRANNRGLDDSNDIPSERDSQFFTIFLSGGSVASNLAVGRFGKESYLAEILNANYWSPNGRPFRVLNGATGGWRVPLPNIMLTLYGQAIDAFVVVDGYNESLPVTSHRRLDEPDWLNYLAVTRPAGSFAVQLGLTSLTAMRRSTLTNPFLANSFLAYFLFLRGMSMVENSADGNAVRAELKSLFDFPSNWSIEKRRNWNLQRYKENIRMLSAQSKALGVHYAHFLQPMRWIGKELTPEEKIPAEYSDKEIYREVFIRAAKELTDEKQPMHSLVDVFIDQRETIYSDNIHCLIKDGESLGYRLISQKMSQNLSKTWNLRPKH